MPFAFYHGKSIEIKMKTIISPSIKVRRLASVSATAKPKEVVIQYNNMPTSFMRISTPVSMSVVNSIIAGMNPVFKTVTPLQALPVLRKVGISSVKELFSFANTFYKKPPAGAAVVNSPALTMAVFTELKRHKVTFERKPRSGRYWGGSRHRRNSNAKQITSAGPTFTKFMAEQLCKTYSIAAYKLCALYKVPTANIDAIVLYMLFGKSSVKVPKKLKAALPLIVATNAKQTTADIDPALAAMKLEDLTVPLCKQWGATLVAALPKMLAAEIKGTVKPKTKTKSYFRPSSYRRARERADARGKSGASIVAKLKATLAPDVYTFLVLTCPQIKKFALSTDKDSTAREKLVLERNHSKPSGYSFRNATPGMRSKMREKYKQLSDELAKLGSASDVLNASLVPKPWMLPFIDSSVNIKVGGRTAKVLLGDGVLSQRLITKANAGKLIAGAPELSSVIDLHSSSLLTLDGINNIIEAVGDSVKTFKTVFSKIVDQIKPLAFTAGMYNAGSSKISLDTAIGKVSNQKLLKLNKVSTEEIRDFEVTYANEIKAWNPLKTSLKDVMVKRDAAQKAKGTKFEVVPATAAQLKEWKADASNYVAGIHNVGVEVVKAWAAKPNKFVEAALSNASKAGKLKIIPNVFHGCPKQAAGVILTFGFKINGTKTNGRSMGNVLYIAPNIDKSAQYLGKSFGRKKGNTGIIFMGDAIVSGLPTRQRHSANDAETGYGWTKSTGFATEEIGLVNPNKQFIVRRVLLVRVTDLPRGRHKGSKKFANLIDASSYSLSKVSGAAKVDPVKATHKVGKVNQANVVNAQARRDARKAGKPLPDGAPVKTARKARAPRVITAPSVRRTRAAAAPAQTRRAPRAPRAVRTVRTTRATRAANAPAQTRGRRSR